MIKKIKKEDKTPVIESQLLKASTAILEYIERSSNGINPKRSLIEEDKTINIEVVYQRSPTERSMLPIILEIPHAFRQDAEICIFTKDPQSTYKQMIKDAKINAKVIAIDKLKNKYKQYESRIKLAGSYDLFLCDIAVVKSLPKLLGSSFFSSKRLIPIEFPSEEKTKNLAKNIIQARDSTQYYRSFGPKCAIKIGNSSLTAQQITDNTLTALSQFIHAVPRGWKNILSLSLSIHGVPSLPFYVTFPEGSLFKRKLEEIEKVSDDEEGENDIIVEDDKELAEENKNFQSESEDNESDISNDSENNINDDVDDLEDDELSEEPTPKKSQPKKNTPSKKTPPPKKTPQSVPKPKKTVQSTPTSSNKKPKLDTKKVSASVTKPSKPTNTETTKKPSSSPFTAPAKSKLRSVVSGAGNKRPRANNKKPNKK